MGERYHVAQLDSLNNMFASDGTERPHLMEFFLFDAILNCAVHLADTIGVADPDKQVVMLWHTMTTTALTSNRIAGTGLPLPSYLEQECFTVPEKGERATAWTYQ